jgi:outer membrane protein, heavy metal efflux system
MPVLFFFLLVVVSGFSSAWAQEESGLDKLIREALLNNPQLRAARHAGAAARTRISQATALDPPQVGYEFYQTPLSSFPLPFRNGMETDYSVQQMFPFPGKRASMAESARNYASMTEQKAYSLERQIVRDLKAAWYELYLAERKLEINSQNRDLLKDLIAVASSQYEVGKGNQADILRVQTELSMLSAEALWLDKDSKVAQAMINSLAGRPAGTPLAAPAEIENELPRWRVEQLDSLALQTRPELKEMHLSVSMSRAELTLSRRERFPDLMLRLMYKDMEMSRDYWSTMVGFSITQAFWSKGKYEARIQENRINIQRTEEELANMQNMVTFQVHSAFEKTEAGRELVNYYRNTVIPQAEQTLLSTIAAYRSGTVDFLMVIDAARMRLRSHDDCQMSIMNYMVSQADLEQAVGLDLTRIAAIIP